MLGAVLIGAMALAITSSLIVALSVRLSVLSSDAATSRASLRAREGLRLGSVWLHRGEPLGAGSLPPYPGLVDSSAEQVELSSVQSPPGSLWRRAEVRVVATSGAAVKKLRGVFELRSHESTTGVVVLGNVEISAPMLIHGSGLRCGGSVRGREWLQFPSSGGQISAPDYTCEGDGWRDASAHAGGGIWSHGVEIHEGGDALYPYDTDEHTEGSGHFSPQAPPAALLSSLSEVALGPGSALRDGVLHLERLASAPSSSGELPSFSGFVVGTTPGHALRVVGHRPPGSPAVTLLLSGDVVLGSRDEPVSLEGAIVVLGSLRVDGPVFLRGHLFARGLRVENRCEIAISPGWRRALPPGLSNPVLLAVI